MVSIKFIFLFMIIFFALIGYLRGWQKEVIALTGLIASLAALSEFGDDIARLVGAFSRADLAGDPFAFRRQQFWVQAIFHSVVAFFSYQVVARLAEQAGGGRLGERLRADLEKRILGALIGAVNGYLFIGGLWGFLEYQITDAGYVQLPPTECYPFDPTVILRPVAACFPFEQVLTGPTTDILTMLPNYLPMGIFAPTVWLILFFVSFFIVIIALI